MKALSLRKKRLEPIPDKSADELLAELARYGSPSMFQLPSGKWFSKVELRVKSTGTDFRVEGMGPTPNAALCLCLKNVEAVVGSVS